MAQYRIKTRLNEILPSIRVPVVSGPMAGAAGGQLAAEVTKGGGFGFIGAALLSPAQLKENLEQAVAALGHGPTAKYSPDAKLDIGVGFLVWKLALMHKAKPEVEESEAIACIDVALEYRPRAIWLAFGTPDDLVHWADVIRQREQAITRDKGGLPAKLFVGIGNEAEAKLAVEKVGADVIVAQGNEAGGHGSSTSPSLLTLLPRIVSLLPTFKPLHPETKPLLLGAGGLANGAGLAALLSLGADGATYGTRFLLTPEATYSQSRKQVLLDVGNTDKQGGITKRSMAFDEARGTLDWPEGVDGRGIINTTVEEYEEGEMDLATRQKTYDVAEKEQDPNRLIVWAGTGIEEVKKKIMNAEDVVHELEEEAIEAMVRVKMAMSETLV